MKVTVTLTTDDRRALSLLRRLLARRCFRDITITAGES
jgi:hypothetical protein